MLECLGTYVERVSISTEQNLDKILQRLKRLQFNIQCLQIESIYKVYSLGLDHAIVFDGIRLFGKTLKELFIYGPCTYYFSLTTLLGLLPALTHLTIKLTHLSSIKPSEEDVYFNEEIQRDIQRYNDDNSSEIYNLFLSLDSEFRRNTNIKQILKRCPRLKFLLVSRAVLSEHGELSRADFARALEPCPSIRYVHLGTNTVSSDTEKKWLTLSRRESRDTDRKDNNDYGKQEANSQRHVTVRSPDEQEHILYLRIILQRMSSLEHLQLFGKCQADFYQLMNNFTRHNINLLSKPSQLKSLDLVNFRVICQPGNDLFFEDFFKYFQDIERLKMHFLMAPVHNLEEEVNYMPNLVRAMGNQLRELRCLQLGFAYDDNRETPMTLCDNLFTILCDSNQKLEVLLLNNVFTSDKMLLDLCHHPKLQMLFLIGRHLHKHLTKDGLILFARKLKERCQSGYGGIQSIFLSCDYWDDVTDEVLEELAGAESLKDLLIQHNRNITDAGVNKFASIKNDMEIELYGCDNVLLDNPHVMLHRPPV